MLVLTHQFYGVLDDLKKTPQRTDYHPEKWVYDHEAYVYAYVRKLHGDTLSEKQLRELEYVALFHDMGKIHTTRKHKKKGYLVSYGHEKAALPYLNAFGKVVGDDLRFDVIKWLVINHMKPKFLTDMKQSTIDALKIEARELGDDVWKMLLLFNQCDNMLRVFEDTDDNTRQNYIADFANFCDELVDKLEDSYKKSDMSRAMFILRGAPGSGKTTAANAIANFSGANASVHSADDFFVGDDGVYRFNGKRIGEAHEDCQRRVEADLQSGKTVMVANTFTKRWEMLHYYRLAAEYRYMVHTMIVENRHGGKNEHNVPENKVQSMRNRFEFEL